MRCVDSMVCESPLSVPLAASAGHVWCSFTVTQDIVGLFFLHPFLLVINAFLMLGYSDFLIYYFVTHWKKQTLSHMSFLGHFECWLCPSLIIVAFVCFTSPNNCYLSIVETPLPSNAFCVSVNPLEVYSGI